jgi:hypothetical protein
MKTVYDNSGNARTILDWATFRPTPKHNWHDYTVRTDDYANGYTYLFRYPEAAEAFRAQPFMRNMYADAAVEGCLFISTRNLGAWRWGYAWEGSGRKVSGPVQQPQD